MQCAIVGRDGTFHVAEDLGSIRSAIAGDNAFAWIDVVDPTPAQLAELHAEFGLHPLALEEASDAHERGKIDAYESFWFIIAHALTPSDDRVGTTEVAVFASDQFVITVRHSPPWPVDEVRRRWSALKGLRRGPGAFVYVVLDALVDGYLPFVAGAEAKLDSIESSLLEQSKRQSRGTKLLEHIIAVKSSLQVMRHAVGPMQDVIERIARGDVRFFQDDEMVYYRNVGTHCKRLISRIDALNDMVSTALMLNVSIAQNRQADIARQLTVVATIFLPLTFITGFFGQNFAFLVNHIQTGADFAIWGIGAEAVAVAVILVLALRRRWL